MTNSPHPSALSPADKESESVRHKRRSLIGLFVGLLTIAIIGGAIYQIRTQTTDFKKLETSITKALKNKDEKALISLAHPEFNVGTPENGGGVVIEPAKVMAKIIQLSKGAQWTGRTEEIENTRILYSEKTSLGLVFNHLPIGWVWNGILSTSPEDLAYLASDEPPVFDQKVEYNEVPTEGPIESEPVE